MFSIIRNQENPNKSQNVIAHSPEWLTWKRMAPPIASKGMVQPEFSSLGVKLSNRFGQSLTVPYKTKHPRTPWAKLLLSGIYPSKGSTRNSSFIQTNQTLA